MHHNKTFTLYLFNRLINSVDFPENIGPSINSMCPFIFWFCSLVFLAGDMFNCRIWFSETDFALLTRCKNHEIIKQSKFSHGQQVEEGI